MPSIPSADRYGLALLDSTAAIKEVLKHLPADDELLELALNLQAQITEVNSVYFKETDLIDYISELDRAKAIAKALYITLDHAERCNAIDYLFQVMDGILVEMSDAYGSVTLILQSESASKKCANRSTNLRSQKTNKFRLLMAFRWFCSPPNQVHVDLVTADLKKDVRSMAKEGRGKFFIHVVVLWRSISGAVVPIFWDGTRRAIAAVLPIGSLIGGIKSIWSK
jgi:hypothetical protein